MKLIIHLSTVDGFCHLSGEGFDTIMVNVKQVNFTELAIAAILLATKYVNTPDEAVYGKIFEIAKQEGEYLKYLYPDLFTVSEPSNGDILLREILTNTITLLANYIESIRVGNTRVGETSIVDLAFDLIVGLFKQTNLIDEYRRERFNISTDQNIMGWYLELKINPNIEILISKPNLKLQDG